MRYEDLENTIFDVPVSVFKNCKDTESRSIPLRGWLTSPDYMDEQMKIRAIENKDERKRLKAMMPAITPSALLNHRKGETTDEQKLISYSGFMQIDIDFKDNTHLPNWSELMKRLSKVKNIAYLGESVSGQGYWGLIPVTEPKNLRLHFKAFSKLLLKEYGIKLDASKGGNFTDLRIYSHTPDAYFNVNAIPFRLKEIQPTFTPITGGKKSASFERCETWVKEKHQFVEGNRNNFLKALAAKCAMYGVELNEAIECSYKYTDAEYNTKRIEQIFKCVYGKIKNQ